MTAVAFRNGVMAADSVAWVGEVAVPTLPKIVRLDDGTLIGCCGDVAIIQWFTSAWPNIRGADSPTVKEDELTALIVYPDGRCFQCEYHLRPFEVRGHFHAVGAPFRFMMGALHAGATAEQAVRLAILHTDGAGGEVQVERLHPALAEAAD